MTKKEHKVLKERREHVRLPILHGILEPVDVNFYDKADTAKSRPQPAILVDLSAGGMRLITFLEPPHSKELNMILKLAGVKEMPIIGRISWVKEKGGVFMNGITFSEISTEDKKRISEMAEDYVDCDTRIALRLPEVCVETCRSHGLCNKPQKDEPLFKKK